MDEEKKILDEQSYKQMYDASRAAAAPTYDGGLRQQQRATYDQITQRPDFAYDIDKDALYKEYRDRYVQQGRMAMKDTMGQAAALTGGYGSSYGQAVGQQQYDAQLQGLNDVVPQLYDRAYQRYADEGTQLQQRYAMLGDMADTDYSQYRDAMADWQYERARQDQQEQTDYSRQQNSYSQLMQMIGTTGYNPSDEELGAAGMTREQAEALRQTWIMSNQQLAYNTGLMTAEEFHAATGQWPVGYQAPGGGGGEWYGGGGDGTPDPGTDDQSLYSVIKNMKDQNATRKEMNAVLSEYGGTVSNAERARISSDLGLTHTDKNYL